MKCHSLFVGGATEWYSSSNNNNTAAYLCASVRTILTGKTYVTGLNSFKQIKI
jgi:hypothetical protein